MSIKHWPAAEQPREKLLARGASSLSDAELLAIFLRTGVAGKSAVDLAREQLQFFGGLRPLLTADQDLLCAAPGMGPAKYAHLHAVLEMSRRYLEQALAKKDVFDSAEATKRYLQAELGGQSREIFHVLFLDTQNALLKSESLFFGTIDSASVYPREVVKKALEYNARSVILAHNHPSGVAEPSSADLAITKRLAAALALIGVDVLDHMIVGDREVASLAERGLM